VLRAAGETETTQENTRDWIELDEEDLGFQLLTEEQIAAVIFFIYFYQHYLYYYIFYLFLFLVFSLWLTFCLINPDYRLIRMTPPPN
jgi:hypothetical protein